MGASYLEPRVVDDGAVRRWSLAGARMMIGSPVLGVTYCVLALLDRYLCVELMARGIGLASAAPALMALALLSYVVIAALIRIIDNGQAMSLKSFACLGSCVIYFGPLMLSDASVSLSFIAQGLNEPFNASGVVSQFSLALFGIYIFPGLAWLPLRLIHQLHTVSAYRLGRRGVLLNEGAVLIVGTVLPSIAMGMSLAEIPSPLVLLLLMWIQTSAYAAFLDIFEHRGIQQKVPTKLPSPCVTAHG